MKTGTVMAFSAPESVTEGGGYTFFVRYPGGNADGTVLRALSSKL